VGGVGTLKKQGSMKTDQQESMMLTGGATHPYPLLGGERSRGENNYSPFPLSPFPFSLSPSFLIT